MKASRILCAMVLATLVLAGVAADAKEQKRDNFVLLIDQSAEMNLTYHSQSLNYLARQTAEAFIRNIPKDIPVKGAIYMYGIMAAETRDKVLTVKNFSPFNKAEFLSAMGEVKKQAGPSSLSIALNRARKDLTEKGITGRTAIIVISGGNATDVGEPTTELVQLKKEHQDACLFPILVGKSKRGGEFLEELREKSKCGFATSAEAIDSEPKMSQYVENVFFKRVGDEDMDGVSDKDDKCPGTPYGADVDSRGCWSINNINFDTGKAIIKPQYFAQLDKIASIMNANPNLRITVEGHTDSVGDEAYNQKLSEQRAQSVMKYLTSAEVDISRLTAVGYGESRPIADNNTTAGKALNRRIEFSYINR